MCYREDPGNDRTRHAKKIVPVRHRSALRDPVPDAKTIWHYREQLARAGAAEKLFARFDALLREKGWLAMGGQIIDATVIDPAVAAADPGREGYAQGRRHAGRVETGTPRSISTATAAGPSSAAANASPRQAMATSARSRSRSRCSATRITSASTASMACCAATPSPTRRRMTAVGTVFDRGNTASDVWADTAYRSAANLALLERRGLRPQFQRKKPRGKKMPAHIARGNATRVRTLKFWCRAR